MEHCPPEPPPDWVAEIARCSPEDALLDLAEVVEADAARMNELPESLREGCVFQFERGSHGTAFFSVTRACPDVRRLDQAVTFQAMEDSIRIAPHASDKFFEIKVSSVWDEESGRRILMVEDEPLELWQISYRALYDLFFGFQDGPAKRPR